MASAIVRSSLRTALRGGVRGNPASKRSFSAGASAEEEAREAAKWEKITYVGIAACTILAFVNLSKGQGPSSFRGTTSEDAKLEFLSRLEHLSALHSEEKSTQLSELTMLKSCLDKLRPGFNKINILLNDVLPKDLHHI